MDCLPTWHFPHIVLIATLGVIIFPVYRWGHFEIVSLLNYIIMEHTEKIMTLMQFSGRLQNRRVKEPLMAQSRTIPWRLIWKMLETDVPGETDGSDWTEGTSPFPETQCISPALRWGVRIHFTLQWTCLECLGWIKAAHFDANWPQALGNCITSSSLLSWRNKDNNTFPRLGLGTS